MNITKSDITKFKALYKKQFNIELDNFEARDKLSKLVRMMEIVYQPITEEQLFRHLERIHSPNNDSKKLK